MTKQTHCPNCGSYGAVLDLDTPNANVGLYYLLLGFPVVVLLVVGALVSMVLKYPFGFIFGLVFTALAVTCLLLPIYFAKLRGRRHELSGLHRCKYCGYSWFGQTVTRNKA